MWVKRTEGGRSLASVARWLVGDRADVSMDDLRPAGGIPSGDLEAVFESSLDLQNILQSLGYSPRTEFTWAKIRDALRGAVSEREAESLVQNLERLEALLGLGGTRRQEIARRRVLEIIPVLREKKELSDLEELKRRVDSWLIGARTVGATAKRKELERLVGDLVGTRRLWRQGWPLTAEATIALRADATEHAVRYLDAKWMGSRFLTALSLTNLLASEIASRVGKKPKIEPATLELVSLWSEIDSGHFAAATLCRRLRRLEGEGTEVLSLVDSLLRTNHRTRAMPVTRQLPWELSAPGWPGASTWQEEFDVRIKLEAILRGLGYSPSAEARCPLLLQQLRAAEDRDPLIEEFAALLTVAPTRRRELARRGVLKALDEVRAADDRQLKERCDDLDEATQIWLLKSQGEEDRHRRQKLELLLRALVETRHQFGREWPLTDEEIAGFRAAAQDHAASYLRLEWLRARELTDYVLTNLLASEVAVLQASSDGRILPDQRRLESALRTVWAEVASGTYDGAALLHRLRTLQTEGVEFLSLVETCLQLHRDDSLGAETQPRATLSWELVDESWLSSRQLEELDASGEEVRRLLEGLGYSPQAEKRWPGLWQELKSLIGVEIPDFSALIAALSEIRESSENGESEAGDPIARARAEKAKDPLLSAVLAAKDDEEAALAILREDSVDQLLPFIEEIPFFRDNQVSWRVPVAIPLLRKRPRDPERFASLLDELVELLDDARTKRRLQARQEVVDSVARLRTALEQEDAYVPAPLKALEAKVVEWLHHAFSAKVIERRRQLEHLLRDLTAARQRWIVGNANSSWPLAEDDIAAYRFSALDCTRRYLGAEWMQTSCLTAHALANLLASELLSCLPYSVDRLSGPTGTLRRVWGEVASGLFDPEESIRRLRDLEPAGIHVHSLVFALLRLEKECRPRPTSVSQ